MRKFEGQVNNIQEPFIFLQQIGLEFVDFFMKGMLISLIDSYKVRELVHELWTKEVEVKFKGIFIVNSHDFIFLNDEQVLW